MMKAPISRHHSAIDSCPRDYFRKMLDLEFVYLCIILKPLPYLKMFFSDFSKCRRPNHAQFEILCLIELLNYWFNNK